MLVILASRSDWSAQALADRWKAHGARVLTANDLSRPGWRCRSGAPDETVAVVAGRTVPAREVAGVLVRVPGVSPDELTHIDPAEREYVASEMTAFLRFWLDGLRCPVVNRPTPLSLGGPGWGPEGWARAAARLGIPVRPVRRRARLNAAEEPVGDDGGGDPVTLTVVAGRCFGEGSEALASRACALAAEAGVDWLAVRFAGRDAGSEFLDANPWPGATPPEAIDALSALLRGAAE